MINKKSAGVLLILLATISAFSFKTAVQNEQYQNLYLRRVQLSQSALETLIQGVSQETVLDDAAKRRIVQQIDSVRLVVKGGDFWWRYFEPNAYKLLNGALPVEWETEVFEKFEKPYKRQGAGLSLAMQYLDEPNADVDSLKQLLHLALLSTHTYMQDSITDNLQSFDHFYYCNRLFLLNLASIYTTGFECPDADIIVPELRFMLKTLEEVYLHYNSAFPDYALSEDYLKLYREAIRFVTESADKYADFDHFTFLREYVNPLYQQNAELLLHYHARSKNLLDYSLNRYATSIFDKHLYKGQNSKGVFANVDDPKVLAEVDRLGKLLFYDPILSGNNQRSCASCHNPKSFFTDTIASSALQFNRQDRLARNTPSLINTPYQHLIMHDGAHITLQDQTRAVIVNPIEMGGQEDLIWAKLMDCKEYRKGFEKLLQYTPQQRELSWSHVLSAITFYYAKFSEAKSPFDSLMNTKTSWVSGDVRSGFNLFMGKAQCATCHFVPQFNGVKPPYVGSEFEVLGAPADSGYRAMSKDKGRYGVFAAGEMLHAFRTGTLRNIMKTAPYMHNGVFKTMDEVIDFYDKGGGLGHGFDVPNQTLPADSLHLSKVEKKQLLAFLQALTENVVFEDAPKALPKSGDKALNQRKIGGVY